MKWPLPENYLYIIIIYICHTTGKLVTEIKRALSYKHTDYRDVDFDYGKMTPIRKYNLVRNSWDIVSHMTIGSCHCLHADCSSL